MRAALFYNPRMLIERLAEVSREGRRSSRLRGTPGARLRGPLLESLELLELLPFTPSVIYDIGSNVGSWTLLAKSVYPLAKIVAFEPLESHCVAYKQTVASLGNVSLRQVALGSEPGHFEMQIPTRSDAASLLPMSAECKDVFDLKFDRSIMVLVERLDDHVRLNHLPTADLLKLDVQGFEHEVLKGGVATLQSAKAVIAEVSFKEFYRGQCRFDQLVSFFACAGFFVHAFGAGTPVGSPLDQCDVLFLKS